MNNRKRLAIIASTLAENNIDLEEFSINIYNKFCTLTFDLSTITPKGLRDIKRTFGTNHHGVYELQQRGSENWKYLAGQTKVNGYIIRAEIHGAFECEVVSEEVIKIEVELSEDQRQAMLKQAQKLVDEASCGVKTETKTERTWSCNPVRPEDQERDEEQAEDWSLLPNDGDF